MLCQIQGALESDLVWPAKRALPDRQLSPVGRLNRISHLYVSFAISVEFGPPEAWASARPFEQVAFVPVPETAVNERNDSVFGQHKVRLSGNLLRVQPVSVAAPVQPFPKKHFWFGVACAYTRHHAAARSW